MRKHIKQRRVLNNIKPYIPGKPIWEVQKELGEKIVIKLASNENPLGASPKALKAISNNFSMINRYPDANAFELKRKLATNLSVSTDQLIITNGADELITLISETYLEEGDEIIVPSPTFSEYEFGAKLMGAKIVPVSLDHHYQYNVASILSAITDRTKLIYICSPNNPTGTYFPKWMLEELFHVIPKHILIVFDSAYCHFATKEDYTDGIEFVRSGYPIVILQTFSKIYGLAGLRVGYGVAPVSVIENILKVKEPFNVNSLAQKAATVAITDFEHVYQTRQLNKSGRELLYKALNKFGIPYTESMSNFVLVEFGKDAKIIYEELLKEGIIVRYGDIWGLPKHIRISIGTEEEIFQLIESISFILINLELVNIGKSIKMNQ